MTDLPKQELYPAPGTKATVRKAELDTAKFILVRNLAHLVYKLPNGSPLMSYYETLDNRELVKKTVLDYEIKTGLVEADGSEKEPLAAPPVSVKPVEETPEKEEEEEMEVLQPAKEMEVPKEVEVPKVTARAPERPPEQPAPQLPRSGLKTRRSSGTAAIAPPGVTPATAPQTPAEPPQALMSPWMVDRSQPPAQQAIVPLPELRELKEMIATLSKGVDALGRLLLDEAKARHEQVASLEAKLLRAVK